MSRTFPAPTCSNACGPDEIFGPRCPQEKVDRDATYAFLRAQVPTMGFKEMDAIFRRVRAIHE